MTKFQPQYFIVCLLTASMWASLGRSSNGDSVGELEREGAGIDQKVETPNLENDNLRLKIDVFKETYDQSGLAELVVHASYLINLAAINAET